MNPSLQRIFCTDAQWVGRADCRHCNIRHLMLFTGLPDEAFDHLLQPIENCIFPAGSILFEEGQNDRAVFSIRSGMIKIMSLTSDGSQRIVRLLGGGAAIGLELLEPGNHYRHSAIAVNEVDACRIPLATMLSLEAEYPQLCPQVRKRLQEHLDRADQWIVTLGTGPARKRVAYLLLLMIEYSTLPNKTIELLGGDDMAAIIGTSAETVSRIIAEFKRRRLLEKVAPNLYRGDVTALQAITLELAR
jgi:CRP-like cAMP-binding protein